MPILLANSDGVLIVLGAIAVAVLVVGLVWLQGWMDRDRIRGYLDSRRCELLEATWAPFGPGWFGEKHETIYFLRFRDADGNLHDAYCKTSMFSGVYFTEDQVVQYLKPPPRSAADLQAENEALRRELEMLRRKQA